MGERAASDLIEGAPLWRRLTLHDQALVLAIGAAIVPPIPDSMEVQDALDMVRELLPLVSRDQVLMRDLAVAAGRLVETWPDRLRRVEEGAFNAWARSQHDAGIALGAVLRIRAVQALERARQESQEVGP
jgi:hypothetical protein